ARNARFALRRRSAIRSPCRPPKRTSASFSRSAGTGRRRSKTCSGPSSSSRDSTIPIRSRAATRISRNCTRLRAAARTRRLGGPAIVYRTPAPANYTYTWRVRDFLFRVLNQTADGPATFPYPIALTYTGTLRFDVTVNDGQGLVVGSSVQSATVSLAYMALGLDRGDYNPGDTISAFYSVASHVITSPTYTYEVDDSAAT